MEKEFLKELKIAVINRDLEKLEKLSNLEIDFSSFSLDELKSLSAYINEAKKIIKEEKNKLSIEMEKLRKLKKFQTQEEYQNFSIKS